MNILLIHQYFLEKDEGGGSRFNEMTAYWASEGHQITVLAGMVHYNTGVKKEKYRKKLFFREKYEERVDVVRCHVSEAYNRNFLGRLWGYLSFTFYSTWAGIFRTRGRYDVILATSPSLFTGLTAWILSFVKRTPFVFEVRDLWPESAIDAGVLKNRLMIRLSFWLESRIYRKARMINVLTPAFREKLILEKKVDSEKICYIPNGVDFTLVDRLPDDFDPITFRKDLDLPEDVFLVIYVGAHGLVNGLDLILETASILKNDPVCFLLIGTGMEKKKLVGKAGLEKIDNVVFMDPVPKNDIYKYIMASDAGISILIRAETFKTIYSNKTFDYMAAGKPILMVIDGISRDLVESADCGLYAEPGNAPDLVEKVRIYIKDRKMAREHGMNGYVYAKKHFNRKELALKYLEELEKVKTAKDRK